MLMLPPPPWLFLNFNPCPLETLRTSLLTKGYPPFCKCSNLKTKSLIHQFIIITDKLIYWYVWEVQWDIKYVFIIELNAIHRLYVSSGSLTCWGHLRDTGTVGSIWESWLIVVDVLHLDDELRLRFQRETCVDVHSLGLQHVERLFLPAKH